VAKAQGGVVSETIRKAALRAAARTAIMLTLSGCALSHVREERAPRAGSGAARDAATAIADAGHDAGRDAGADAARSSCEEHLGALAIVASESGWGNQFADEGARSDPFTGDCCMEIESQTTIGTGGLPEGVSTELAMACCDTLVFVQHRESSSNLGCTPWGPPCPPEMPQDAPALA